MGLGYGIKIAKRSLGFLAMQDELEKRLELAVGTIRELRTSSKSDDTSKKNGIKVDRIVEAFETLTEGLHESRDFEILASKLVEVCVDIIEENAKDRTKK